VVVDWVAVRSPKAVYSFARGVQLVTEKQLIKKGNIFEKQRDCYEIVIKKAVIFVDFAVVV
jgi:hypothetical protein